MRVPTERERAQHRAISGGRPGLGRGHAGLGPSSGDRAAARALRLSNLGRTPHNAEHVSEGRATVELPQSPGERRKWRMWKGIATWYAEVMAKGGPRRGVALIALTFAGEPETHAAARRALAAACLGVVAAGEWVADETRRDCLAVAVAALASGQAEAFYGNKVRQFWDSYRKAFGNVQYFCWAELQQRGVIHYHAMVVDAPPIEKGHTADRLRHMWGLGRVNVEWRSAGWFAEEATGYAGNYAKKFGNKAYQQEYSKVPPTVRTFGCSRITTPQGRVARTPGWAKMVAKDRGYGMLDARRRPNSRGWLLRMSDQASGEVFTARWSCGACLIRGPSGRPAAALLGPVWTHFDSRYAPVKLARPMVHPSRARGPIRLGGTGSTRH